MKNGTSQRAMLQTTCLLLLFSFTMGEILFSFPTKSRTLPSEETQFEAKNPRKRLHQRILSGLSDLYQNTKTRIARWGNSLSSSKSKNFKGSRKGNVEERKREMNWKVRQMELLEKKMEGVNGGRKVKYVEQRGEERGLAKGKGAEVEGTGAENR